MPVCFQLFPIGSKEPIGLIAVDNAICAHFGVDPDPIKYHASWYDSIGLRLALGWDWDRIREDCRANASEREEWSEYYTHMLAIVDFLESRYTPNSWREIGR